MPTFQWCKFFLKGWNLFPLNFYALTLNIVSLFKIYSPFLEIFIKIDTLGKHFQCINTSNTLQRIY